MYKTISATNSIQLISIEKEFEMFFMVKLTVSVNTRLFTC